MTSSAIAEKQQDAAQAVSRSDGVLSMVALFASLTLAAIIAFGPTLSLPFFGDDLDLMSEAGKYRAGVASLSAYLSLNHNEHRIPVMRTLVYFATLGGDLDSRTFHAAVLAVHIWSAVLVALIARPMMGRKTAYLCGLLFVVSGAFSSMVIWAPTSAVFSLSLLFVLLARHCLANYTHAGVWLASLALLLATLSLNASVIAVPLLAVAYWDRLGTSTPRRIAVFAIWLLAAARIFLWSSAMFMGGGDGLLASIWPAIRNGGFLVLSAPLRWVLAWSPVGFWNIPGAPLTLVALLVASLVGLGALWMPRETRKHMIVLLLSACGIAMAVGYGRRAESFPILYWTDRYYHAFGAPFALITAAFLQRLLTRITTRFALVAVLIVVLAVGTFQSRRRITPQLAAPHVGAHRVAMEQARSLAKLLREESARRPMRVGDGLIPFSGVHKDGMTLTTIVYGVYPTGVPGLEIAPGGGRNDDERLNRVLGAWAQNIGWAGSPVLAEQGSLRPVTTPEIDFRHGAFSSQIVSGFHDWSSSVLSRWMSKRGVLEFPYAGQKRVTIEAQLPAGELRKAGVIGPTDEVIVRANGTQIGVLKFDGPEMIAPSFELPAGIGSSVQLSLESSFTWHARQIYPENADPRELSITVVSAKLTN